MILSSPLEMGSMKQEPCLTCCLLEVQASPQPGTWQVLGKSLLNDELKGGQVQAVSVTD